MQIIAKAKSVMISPRKVRLVADTLKRMSPTEALMMLEQTQKRPSMTLIKIIKSALANAQNNAKLDVSTLCIKTIDIVPGPALKRFHPSSRGRVHPYKKRSSHITVVLEEKVKKGEKASS